MEHLKTCQGSCWPTVTIEERTSDSSADKYTTSLFEEHFRTRLDVTDGLWSGRNLAENQLIAESSSRVQSLNVPQLAQGKAIPLCLPNNLSWDPITGEIRKTKDNRRSLYVVPTAVKILKAIKEPVCVVSIAGPCREGKSYILAEVFGETDVFSIGHEMDPETMGLWMWIVRQEFKDSSGRDFTVILLDSEGINAVTAEGQNDNQIFTLTVLLASVLIYNSKGVPKRNDLNDLKYLLLLFV